MMDQGVAAPTPAEAHNLQDLPLALFIDDLDEYNQFRNYVSSMPGRMSPPRQQISHDPYHSQIPITSAYRDHASYQHLGTSPEKIYTTLQSRTDFSISSLAAPPPRNSSSVEPPPNEKMYHQMSNQSTNNYNNSSSMSEERSYHSLMSKNNNCNNSSPMINDQSMQYHHMYNNRPANCNSPGENMAGTGAPPMDQRYHQQMPNQRPYNSSSPMSTSDERTYHSLNSRPPSTHMQQGGGTNNATSVIMSAHNSPVPPGAPPPSAMPNGPCGMGGMTPRDNGHMDGHMDRHMETNPDWQMGGHQVNDVNNVTSSHQQNYMDRSAVNANYTNSTNNHRHSQHSEVPYDNGNYNHNRYEHGEESQALNMSKGSTKEVPKFVANNTKIKTERIDHVSSSSVPHHGYTPQAELRKDKMSSSYQLNNPRLKKVDIQFFKCSLCSYRTKLEKSYEKHVEWHKKCKHKCDICNASFSNDKSLRDHKYQHLRKEQPKFSDSFSEFIKKSTEKDKVETTNLATTNYKKTKQPINPRKPKSASVPLKAEDVKFVKNKDLVKDGKKVMNKRSTEVYNMIGMLLKEQTSPLNLSQQRAKSSLDKRLQGISNSLQKTQSTKPGAKQAGDAYAMAKQAVNAHASTKQPIDSHSSTKQPIDSHASTKHHVDSHASTKQPVDAYASTKQPVDAYSSTKQPVDAYSSTKQPVDAYSSTKQSNDAYATSKQPVNAYASAKQPVDAYATTKHPGNAYSSAKQSINPYASTKQSVDAYSVSKHAVDAPLIPDVKPEIKTEILPNVKMVTKPPMSSASCSSSSSSSNIFSNSISSSIANSGYSTSLTNNGLAQSFSNSALSNSGVLPSSLMSSGFPSPLVSSGLPTSFTSSGLQSPLASSGLMNSVVPTSLTNSLLAPSLMNTAVPNSFANQLSGMSAQLTSSSFQNSLMNNTIQNSFMNNEAVPSSLRNFNKFMNFNQAPQSQNPQSRKRDYFNIQQFF